MSYEKHKTSNKRILESEKYKSDAKDKVASNDTKKKKDINERSKYCSDLEAELIKKHIERSVPSSSQEFQNSKTFNDLKFKRKFSCTSDDCTSIAEDEPGGKVRISQEESLYFKSNVTKILNELKEICSEYELKTEYVRWHHLKKELVYQASANSVIKKSMNVIKKLKIKLDNQETKLMRFSEEWNKKCCARNIRHDDSISSGGELLEIIKTHDTSNASEKSLLSEEGSIFYGSTDSDETFFDNEVIEAATEKNKTNELSLSVIILEEEDNNNENITSPTDNEVMSPILGSNNKKLLSNNAKANRKPQIIHKSADVSEEFEGNLINDSSEDLVKRGMTENDTVQNTSEKEQISLLGGNNEETSAKTDQKKGDKSLEENEFDTEIYNDEFLKILALKTVISEENASSKTDDSESTVKVGKDTQSSWDEIDDDEVQADIARFRCRNISDLEPVPNNVSASEKSGTDSNDLDRIEKAWDISINKNSLSSNDNIDIAFLDSNTDHSMDSCSTFVMFRDHDPDNNNERNKQAKALLLDSSNSEDSSTDYDDSPQLATVSISSKKQKAGDELESPQDETLGELDPWLSKSVKKKPHNLNSKYESEEKLRMQSYVPLERLPEEVLEKHDGALKKSRQHLDDKQIKSLTNLKALGRYTSKASGSSQSSTFKKFKVPAEREDTLLDHLKRVESGELTENIEEDAVVYYENRPTEITSGIQSNNELMMEADNIAKNLLLNSDSSNSEYQNVASSHGSNDEDKREEAKPKSNATKWLKIPRKQCVASNVDAADKREKSMWKRHKLLTMTFSSSDSEVETAKWDEKRGKLKKKTEENQTENSIMDPDSDTEMADDNFMLGMKQRKTRMQTIYTSPDTDSSIGEEKAMPIRKMNTDRDNDDDSDDEGANCQEISVNKGRKNIRKVMKDMQVAEDTKRVAKEEEERLQRIAHRQKLYHEMYQVSLASKEKMKKLVLDFDTETKEELVSVHPDIVKRLKPHQAKGIKFMWDVCFESLERTKSSSGSGCILAHCMGLGKCLQVIALLHTLLNHEETGIKVIAIVCPLNTILNWYNEFNLWLGDIEGNNVIVYELTKLKQDMQRKSQLKSWHRTGGVLLISYEMFRNLTCTTNKMLEATRKEVLRYLIDPGPDLIICDEGHLLKNEDTALSRSMKRIKTLRRIALTGTPLQNNLIEYHCMVQFVKPYLLGTKKEFLNRFVNPINNGQYDNSTENDVRLMKQRAYVLHKMLRGCVQRFNYSVLTPLLPPKQEYVIFVRLSDVQIKMYRYYLDNFARCRHSRSRSFFSDYQMLQKIWTHPVVMGLHAEKAQKISEKKFQSDAEGWVRDFTDDTTEHNLDIEKIVSSEEIRKEEEKWWTQFIESDHLEDISISSKLMLFFGILKESEQIGDKLLVFSQFLHSLTLIENFLRKIDDKTQEGENSKRMGHRSWSLDLDYFRLDGQTSAEKRIRLCKEFNSPTNTRARLFLISTRAGGLGINLTAANRVILFDVSWNPSNDVQSIFRVYRFGQKKPSYVYRFLAAGTMEEKIYNRQVTKLSLSCRVVDEQQIGRHYRIHDVNELYTFEPNTEGERPTLNLPKDRLLAEIFLKYKDYVENYHEHDSLLENMTEEELNEEERKQAWQAFRLTSDTIYRD